MKHNHSFETQQTSTIETQLTANMELTAEEFSKGRLKIFHSLRVDSVTNCLCSSGLFGTQFTADGFTKESAKILQSVGNVNEATRYLGS
jgi:hypothetical protein